MLDTQAPVATLESVRDRLPVRLAHFSRLTSHSSSNTSVRNSMLSASLIGRSSAFVPPLERGGKAFVPKAAPLQDTGLRRIIDIVDTEALGVAGRPLKVIEERPHEVATHVDAALDGIGNGPHVRFDIGAPIFILNASVDHRIPIGCAVFGYEQRWKVVLPVEANE